VAQWLAVVTGLVLLAPAAGPEQAKQEASAPKADTPREAAAFRVGEKLHYRISWANLMTAATAEVAVLERRPFYGREAWHFQALARTVDAARLLYTLEDQFDSYTETATLASFRYEAYLREQKKQETSIVRMSGDGLPQQDDGPMTRVLAGTRDPLGLLFYLRAHDWKKESRVHTYVFDGKKLYEIHARVTGREAIAVPAGNYETNRVQLQVFHRKQELTDVRMSVWIAEDAQRTPALMEADMPFGRLRVELVRVQ
jgi:hypothetical protein